MISMRKKIRTIISIIILCSIPFYAFASEKKNEINIGDEYGTIYGTERNPEQGDTSKWLTIQNGDSGVRIMAKDGKEIVAVDNYGGIYLNGDVFMNGEKIDPKQSYKSNGFMYLLIIISLVLNGYLLINRRKKV